MSENRSETGIDLMDQIKPQLPNGVGAMLLLYDYEPPGEISYTCTGDRKNMRVALRSILAKWEEEDWGKQN